MNKELIGKCYRREERQSFDSYIKITGKTSTSIGEDCLTSEVFFNTAAKGAATISVNNSNRISWIKRHYAEIPHEEFIEAYDKALNIINEYRTKL